MNSTSSSYDFQNTIVPCCTFCSKMDCPILIMCCGDGICQSCIFSKIWKIQGFCPLCSCKIDKSFTWKQNIKSPIDGLQKIHLSYYESSPNIYKTIVGYRDISSA